MSARDTIGQIDLTPVQLTRVQEWTFNHFVPPRCAACGEVIGAFEPFRTVGGGTVADRVRYHARCTAPKGVGSNAGVDGGRGQ